MNKAGIAIALLLLCATLVASRKKTEEECLAAANDGVDEADQIQNAADLDADKKTEYDACLDEEFTDAPKTDAPKKGKKKKGKQ